MKKIPRSVDIGGLKFRIVICAIESGDYGRMLFDERKILISTKCLVKGSLIRETLRHEMFHAAMYVSGVAFLEKYEDETITRAVENVFFPAWDKIHEKLISL